MKSVRSEGVTKLGFAVAIHWKFLLAVWQTSSIRFCGLAFHHRNPVCARHDLKLHGIHLRLRLTLFVDEPRADCLAAGLYFTCPRPGISLHSLHASFVVVRFAEVVVGVVGVLLRS